MSCALVALASRPPAVRARHEARQRSAGCLAVAGRLVTLRRRVIIAGVYRAVTFHVDLLLAHRAG